MANQAELSSFLDRMRKMVLEEDRQQKEQVHKIWKKPLATRVADGYALEGIQIIEKNSRGQIVLHCTRNESRFREGDTLQMSQGNPFEEPSFNVVVEEDDETTLLVNVIDMGFDWGEVSRQRTGWVLDLGVVEVSHFYLAALNDMAETFAGRERILPMLLGAHTPRSNGPRFGRAYDMGEAFDLNDEQCDALAAAYATDSLHLIQGPPGTGKTRLLAHLALALMGDGERVLVTGLTHRAVNNALNKIHEIHPDGMIYKIGPDVRADDLNIDNYEDFANCPAAKAREGYIIGATPFALRTSRLRGIDFETVIFDEASQITLPLAIMGMLAGQRYIFIGDPDQLPPIFTAKLPEQFQRSIFEHLEGDGENMTMLMTTYRMNSTLTAWPSEKFYGRDLISAFPDRELQLKQEPRRLKKVVNPREPLIFWEQPHMNQSVKSAKEAEAAVELIQVFLEAGVPAAEIGVVVPFRAQGRLIRNLLRRHVQTADRQQIVVDTVERMQGQEREVVILSLTTSNTAFAAEMAEFLFQPQRLNVAVTRPRSKLVIIGSGQLRKTEPIESHLQENVQLLDDLLASCAKVFGINHG